MSGFHLDRHHDRLEGVVLVRAGEFRGFVGRCEVQDDRFVLQLAEDRDVEGNFVSICMIF